MKTLYYILFNSIKNYNNLIKRKKENKMEKNSHFYKYNNNMRNISNCYKIGNRCYNCKQGNANSPTWNNN